MGRGRPKGSKTRRSLHPAYAKQAAKAVDASLEDTGLEPFEGDAHLFLMAVYKNPTHALPIRIDAAKSALPYEKPRLAPADGAQKTEGMSLKDRLAAYSTEAKIEASDGKVVGIRRK